VDFTAFMNQEIIDKITTTFSSTFGSKPLLVASPGRINLIGEHTDYNNGFVFPAAIDKYIYAGINKASSGNCTVIALVANEQIEFDINSIQAISNGGWQNYILGVVGELQKIGKQIGAFNFLFSGDIPMGAGLSSSAALENSLVFGLNELFNLGLSRMEMILISQKAEHNYVGVKCGIMDQFASMMGDKKHALFLDCMTMKYEAVPLNLGDYVFLLLNTNVKHSLADSAYNKRRNTCETVVQQLNELGNDFSSLRDAINFKKDDLGKAVKGVPYNRSIYVIEELNRVLAAKKALLDNDLDLLGELMYQSHAGLQYLYEVSCQELDFLVEQAKTSDAIKGARMMGGGFGGCTINLIHKNAIESFIEKTSSLYKKTFDNELSAYVVRLSKGTCLL